MTIRQQSFAQMVDVWRDSPVSGVAPKSLLLVTDFDGTLADIVPKPADAVARPEALEALRSLVSRLGWVIVISGRTDAELKGFLPVAGAQLVGELGASPLTRAERRVLQWFNTEAARLTSGLPGVWLEFKTAGTAIHHRHSESSGQDLLALLGPLLAATGLDGVVGRKVIEVHPARASKGLALEALLAQVSPGGVICLGDDENDRPIFDLVHGLPIPHLSVGVTSPEVAPDLFAHCELVVEDPQEVAGFLDMVASWASDAHAAQ